MKNKVFLFVGVILILVGIIIFFSFVTEPSTIMVQGQPVNDSGLWRLLKYSISGGIASLGGFFLLIGVVGVARESKENQKKLQILQSGIETEGAVTFVDKNYSLLINNQPIYSIVEYNYQDKNGIQYTRRIENVRSDIVIRNRIEVGSIVSIKYDAVDPSSSIILLKTTERQPLPKEKCNYCGLKYSTSKYENCPKCGAH